MTAVLEEQELTAVETFLLADSWEGSLAVLEEVPGLASDRVIDLLGSLVHEAKEIGDERSAELLEKHRALLEQCNEEGTSNVLRKIRREHPRAGTLEEILTELAEASPEPPNMLRRIELCRQGLAMVDSREEPEIWAVLRAALGTALLRRPIGDRRAAVEEAIVALDESVSALHLAPPERARALNNLGQAHLAVTWDADERHVEAAIKAYEDALALSLTEAAERAQTLSNLGTAYLKRKRGLRQENLDTAVDHYRHALDYLSRDDHPYEWGHIQTNLGVALAKRHREEDLDEAIEAFRRACMVIDPGGFPVEWAVARTHMGTALQRRGAARGGSADVEDAILAHESALGALIEQRAPAERALTLANLGNALLARGAEDDVDRAIACYEEALAWLEPETAPLEWAQAQNDLGNAFRRRARETGSGEHALEAVAAYEQACEVLAPTTSPVEYAQTMKNLGASYAILDQIEPGRFTEPAKAAFREALAVREEVYGREHARVASVLYSLSRVQWNAGDWTGARESLERALAIDEQSGERYPRMASRYRRLATAAQEMGDLEVAERALLRALQIDEDEHGSEHPDVFADLTALGNVRRLRGDKPAATRDLERALEIGAEEESSVQMRSALASLADVLHRAGNAVEAEKTLERAIKLDRKLYGPEHPRAQTTILKLAEGLYRASETASSDETLERALELGRHEYLGQYPNLAAWTAALAQLTQGHAGSTQTSPDEGHRLGT